jgi:hypothetical protein
MPKVVLTDRFAAHAKAQGVPQLDYFDESIPALHCAFRPLAARLGPFITPRRAMANARA